MAAAALLSPGDPRGNSIAADRRFVLDRKEALAGVNDASTQHHAGALASHVDRKGVATVPLRLAL